MNIEKNIPLHDKNWFQTGGPARYYAQPTTPEEFAQALSFANKNSLALTLLGEGANVLISDNGFDGLVIKPALKKIDVISNTPHIQFEAGVTIQEAINSALEHNLIGIEEFSGIPGSIGGATYMNLHYFDFFLSQFVIEAQVIEKDTGQLKTVDNSWFAFGYDQSKLHEKQWFLINVTLALTKATDLKTAYAQGRRDEIIRQRNARYPTSHTCGSFFRNFHHDELISVKNAKKLPYIAYYLDQLGIKGTLSYGDAIVSHRHANMLVNQGKASSHDIIMLAQKMQELVLKHFGIIPQPECQLIGFKEYPLHTTLPIKSLQPPQLQP